MKLLNSAESRIDFSPSHTSKGLQISQKVKHICIFKIIFLAASVLVLQKFHLENIFLVLYENGRYTGTESKASMK